MFGRICIWRYLENEKNYPGYHISIDPQCAEVIARDLRGLDQGPVSFQLSSPTSTELAVPNNLNNNARVEAYTTLVIEVIPTSNKNRKLFSVESNYPNLRILASSDQLQTFFKHVQRCAKGYFDYSWGRGKASRFTFW